MIKLHTDLMALLHWSQRFPRARAFSCGLLSALLLILSFPFFESDGLWWLAVLIPLPLMVIANEPVIRPSRAGFFAAIGTIPAWAWTHQWMWDVSKMGTPILLLYLAFYPGLFVWGGNRVVKRFGRAWITLPMVWIGIEFLRGHAAFTGYPWYLSAQPLIDSPGQILAGPAGLAGDGGMYLVGLLSAILAWQFWGLVRLDSIGSRLFSVVGVLGLWIAMGTLGLTRTDTGGDEPRMLRVGIVQPDVPQDNRMDWTDRQRYLDWMMLRELTIASARDPEMTPEMIVWPEGFVPGWTFDPSSLEHEREHGFTWKIGPHRPGEPAWLRALPERIAATTVVDELLVMQKYLGIPMVVGSVAFENLKIERDDADWVMYTNDGMYNSAFVVADGAVDPVWYNKMHLTPFGEVMPVISRWEWLEQQLLGLGAEGMQFILSAGDDPVVLEVPTAEGPVRVGTPICFEATVPGVCRDLVLDGAQRKADLLVNITNDGWFGAWDPSRRTHMLAARWRCIELATPMIRSANTGVSCVIDRRGGIVQEDLSRMDPNDPLSGYLNAEVEVGGGVPIATAMGISGVLGLLSGWGMLGLTALGMILGVVQKRSEPDPRADE